MGKPTIRVHCSIPKTLSGFRSDGDVIRVLLEIPKSDVEKAVGLMALQGEALIARFEVDAQSAARGGKYG